VCLAGARLVQASQARTLLAKYATAPEDAIDVQSVPDGEFVRLTPVLFEPAEHRHRIQQAMLVLNVSATCDVTDIPLHVRYSGDAAPAVDFSQDFTVRVPDRAISSRMFLQVYSIESREGHVSRFSSVDVSERVSSCVRLARARETERLPLMLDATLPTNWNAAPMYERLYLGPLLPERIWVRVARWWPRVAALG